MSGKVLQSAGVCSRLLVALSAVSILALGLGGCGGGGGGGIVPNTPGGGGIGGGGIPPSGNPSKGALRIQVTIDGSSGRAIPEVGSVALTVMGAGLTTPLQASLTPAQPTASFSDVPVGEKAILASVSPPFGGKVIGLNAALAKVQAGSTTTATLNISLASPPGMLNAVFSGTKDVNGVTTQVLKLSDGREEYYSYDKSPPASGPANALLQGSLRAGQSVPDTWSPALIVAPAKLQLGNVITQTVTEKFADGTSETQTEKLSYEGNEGVLVGGEFGGATQAAKVRRLLQGTKVNTARLMWLAQFTGPVVDLDLDPASGGVTGVRMLSQSVGTGFAFAKSGRSLAPRASVPAINRAGRQVGNATNSYFPLGGGIALSYLSSQASGANVGITVGLPFGVTGGFTSNNSDNAVLVRFSKALNTTDAVNIANYALESPVGTPVSLASATVLLVPEPPTSGGAFAVAKTSARSIATRQAAQPVVKSVLIQGPSLTLGNDFKVTVGAIHESGGTTLTQDGVYNTLKGKVDVDRFPPLIVSTKADSYNLTLTFSEKVKSGSGSFSVESPAGTSNFSGTPTLDATGKIVTLTFPKDNPLNGPDYRVTVNSISDLNGNSGSSFQNPGLVSTGTVTDIDPPRVVGSSAKPDKLTLTFSERVQKTDAENKANYEIESPEGSSLLSLAAATLAYDDKTQTVAITGLTFNASFKVRVSNISDLAGNKMDWQIVKGSVGAPPLRVASVDAATDHLWVTFSHSVVQSGAENPLNYLIESPSGTKVDTSAAGTLYDDTSKTVVFRGVTLTAGKTVKVTVRNVQPSYYSGATNMPEDGVANVGSTTVPATKLRVQSGSSTTTTVTVVFSEAVNATDAVDTTRYSVQSPIGSAHYINTITYNASTNTATITLQSYSPMNPGDPCKVVVRNIRNAANTATLSVDFIQGNVGGALAQAPQPSGFRAFFARVVDWLRDVLPFV